MAARVIPSSAAAAVLFLAAAIASAFEGRVVLQGTGAPVAGAEVSILGWNIVQLTDPAGRFTWELTPAPPFEVLVVSSGRALHAPRARREIARAGARDD